MSIIFITKCLFIYFSLTCEKYLVESTETSTNTSPGTQGGTSVTTPSDGNTDSGSKTGVELSLNATAATDQFDYEDECVTFTPKDNYGFKSVKTGKNGDIVVWSTTNASEYATKVVLNCKGKMKKVTIHLPNNSTKVFDKDKNKPWNELSHQTNQATGQPTSGTAASGGSLDNEENEEPGSGLEGHGQTVGGSYDKGDNKQSKKQSASRGPVSSHKGTGGSHDKGENKQSKKHSRPRGFVSSHKGTGGSHDCDDENEEAGRYDEDEGAMVRGGTVDSGEEK